MIPAAPVKVVKFPLHELAGHNLLFTRIAGISGASAIAINAYYTHYHKSNPYKDPELKLIFEKTSKFHFIHSLVLLAVPLVRRPWLVSFYYFSVLIFVHKLTIVDGFTDDCSNDTVLWKWLLSCFHWQFKIS